MANPNETSIVNISKEEEITVEKAEDIRAKLRQRMCKLWPDKLT